MKPNSYTEYLETLVVSLLGERSDPKEDIASANDEDPRFKNCTFSPYAVLEEVSRQRSKRKDVSMPKPMERFDHHKRTILVFDEATDAAVIALEVAQAIRSSSQELEKEEAYWWRDGTLKVELFWK